MKPVRPTFLFAALILLSVTAIACEETGPVADLAQRGEKVFSGKCAECHGENGEGHIGPVLFGSPYIGPRHQNAATLLGFVMAKAPMNDPGSLSDNNYYRVLSLILLENNFTGGETIFDPAALAQITFTD